MFARDLNRTLGNGRRGTAEPQRIVALRQAFAGQLPGVMENKLSELRRLSLAGRELALRLELLRERYRLNPTTLSETAATSQATRIIRSGSLL